MQLSAFTISILIVKALTAAFLFYSTSKQLQELELERKKIVQQLKEKEAKCQGITIIFLALLV